MHPGSAQPLVFQGFSAFFGVEPTAMIRGCETNAAWTMHTDSLASAPIRRSGDFSATPRRESCASFAGEKNGVWDLRTEPTDLLRPQDPSHPRSLLRRHARLPGGRSPACLLPELLGREAGEAALAGRQSVLHSALRLLCRPAVPDRDDPGCGSRAAPRLEDGQGAGDGVHARATPASRDAGPRGDRHRQISIGRGPRYRIVVSD